MFSLESPHRGDSNKYTQYTIFSIKKKTTPNYPKSAAKGFFKGTQERVRNSCGKRVISVRATEVLLYLVRNIAERENIGSTEMFLYSNLKKRRSEIMQGS